MDESPSGRYHMDDFEWLDLPEIDLDELLDQVDCDGISSSKEKIRAEVQEDDLESFDLQFLDPPSSSGISNSTEDDQKNKKKNRLPMDDLESLDLQFLDPPSSSGISNSTEDDQKNRLFTATDKKKLEIKNGKRKMMEEGADPYPAKKKRFSWTSTMHQKFLDAIQSIGHERVVPRRIVQEMGVDGLTTQIVSSHLQRHRKLTKQKETLAIVIQEPSPSLPVDVDNPTSGLEGSNEILYGHGQGPLNAIQTEPNGLGGNVVDIMDQFFSYRDYLNDFGADEEQIEDETNLLLSLVELLEINIREPVLLVSFMGVQVQSQTL